MEWMFLPLKRYAEFTGRSRRKEYWMWTLFYVAVTIICYAIVFGSVFANFGAGLEIGPDAASNGVLDSFGMTAIIGLVTLGIFGLATLVPGLAVNVRRCHDRGWSGWVFASWLVLYFVSGMLFPLLPLLLLIGWAIVMALPGDQGSNKYGPDPKDPTSSSVFE